MKHVHKNSDLLYVLKITDSTGAEINPQDYSFCLSFFTRRYSQVAFHIETGEPPPNGIQFDGNSIRVYLENQNFATGEILFEISLDMPDANFPDGYRTVSSGLMHTNVYVHDHFENRKIAEHHGLCNCDYYIALQLDGDGNGTGGLDGKSAYEIWLSEGNAGTKQDFLDSLQGAPGLPGSPGAPGGPGNPGKSAYQIWLEEGNGGSEQDFLESLKGTDGTDGSADIQAHDGSSTAHPVIRAMIDSLSFVKSVEYNDTTGDVTITKRDNSTLTFNIIIAGCIHGLYYDPETAELVITKADNSKVRVPLSHLIDIYVGHNGTHIQTTVESGNVIHSVLKAGTITSAELAPALIDLIDGKVDEVQAGTVKPQSRIMGAWVDTPETATKLITLSGCAATVTYEIMTYTDYAFVEGTLDSIGVLSVTDTVGLKSGSISTMTNAGFLANDWWVSKGVMFKAFWDGSRWMLGTARSLAISTVIESATGKVPQTKLLYDLDQGIKADYRKSIDQDDIDSGKVDKVSGMGLSETSFTQDEKDKLANLDSSKFLGAFGSVLQLQADYPDGGVGGNWGTFVGDKEGCAADVSISGIVHEFAYNSGAWVDMGQTGSDSAAMIKQKYESNADTNAFTDAEKNKLSGIETGAQKNVQSSWTQNDTGADNYIIGKPTNLSQFNNDSNFITSASLPDLSPYYVKPSGGIPATDLESAIQNLLGLANTALQPADLSGHNISGTAHNDLRILIDTVKAIAEGKSRGRSFNTKAALDAWLTVPANLTELQVGDNFYIEETDVPDYWWTGTGILPLEIDKVFLLDYYTKAQADGRYLQAITKALVEAVLTVDISTHTHSQYLTGISKALIEAQLTGDILTHTHSGYAVAGHSHPESVATVSTLVGLPVDKDVVYATIGASQSLSLSGTPAPNHSFHVFILATAAVAVAIPNDDVTYVSMSGTAFSVPAGGRLEANIVYKSDEGKYIITVAEKQ